jgi:polysaccharide biosynthesis protein PslH
VPLRVGGGTRLKIYEALAMETPVVSTTVGAEGLPLQDGEELLLADEPALFADAVARILEDPDRRRELGCRAAARVRSEFGWDSVAQKFAISCREVVENARKEGAAAVQPGPSIGANELR